MSDKVIPLPVVKVERDDEFEYRTPLDELRDLRLENEKLRSVLTRIAEGAGSYESSWRVYARAALASKP